MRTLLTGQQGTPALCPASRAFFSFFYFYFWRKFIFFKKNNKKLYFLPVFPLFLSLFLSNTHTLGSFEFNEFHQSKMRRKTQKRCSINLHTNYRSIRASWLSTDQVSLSNNNPHWNLLLCDFLTFKIFMVQPTRLYNLIYGTCVKSSVVRGPGPVVRRCSP